MIILKCIEISNHHVVHQELTRCWPTIFQKQTHSEKVIRFVVTRGEEQEEGEMNEGSQKVQTSSYKINKY